jgi:hypothetical protein
LRRRSSSSSTTRSPIDALPLLPLEVDPPPPLLDDECLREDESSLRPRTKNIAPRPTQPPSSTNPPIKMSAITPPPIPDFCGGGTPIGICIGAPHRWQA